MSNWPVKYMEKEVFKKGKLLFKAGDRADKIYYINIQEIPAKGLATEKEIRKMYDKKCGLLGDVIDDDVDDEDESDVLFKACPPLWLENSLVDTNFKQYFLKEFINILLARGCKIKIMD